MQGIRRTRGATPWRLLQEQEQWQQAYSFLKILDISLMNQDFFDKKTIVL